jgi:hypothetical protein
MELSAWLMFGFGCLVLYGGLALCIGIAMRKQGQASDQTTEKT